MQQSVEFANSLNLDDAKVVEIHWVDSMATPGWFGHLEEAKQSMLIRTVGFLVADLDDRVVITSTISSESLIMDPLVIPRVAIVEQYEVRFERPA